MKYMNKLNEVTVVSIFWPDYYFIVFASTGIRRLPACVFNSGFALIQSLYEASLLATDKTH